MAEHCPQFRILPRVARTAKKLDLQWDPAVTGAAKGGVVLECAFALIRLHDIKRARGSRLRCSDVIGSGGN